MLALSVILGLLNVLMESIQELDVVNPNHMVMVMVIMRTLVTLSVIRLRLNVPMALTKKNALASQNNQKNYFYKGTHQWALAYSKTR
jgi:hypothetical protein